MPLYLGSEQIASGGGGFSAVDSIVAGLVDNSAVDWCAVSDNNGDTGAVFDALVGGGFPGANLDTMAAVVASSTAMAAVVASSTAMAEVLLSNNASDQIWSSETASDAIWASLTAGSASTSLAKTTVTGVPDQYSGGRALHLQGDGSNIYKSDGWELQLDLSQVSKLSIWIKYRNYAGAIFTINEDTLNHGSESSTWAKYSYNVGAFTGISVLKFGGHTGSKRSFDFTGITLEA